MSVKPQPSLEEFIQSHPGTFNRRRQYILAILKGGLANAGADNATAESAVRIADRIIDLTERGGQ